MTVMATDRAEFAAEHWSKPRMIPVEQCFIDTTYQRRPNITRARDMAKDWKPALATPITVSKREINGETVFAVVDGQHRYEAARQRGLEYIAAYVKEDLTVQEEAKLFHDMNAGQKPTTPRDNFRADFTSGSQDAVQIVTIVRECGFYVDGTPNWDLPKARMIPVGVACEIYRAEKDGALLKKVLCLLGDAWTFLGTEEGTKPLNGALFIAVARIVSRANNSQLKRFKERMSVIRPEVVEGTVITKAAQDQRKVALGNLSAAKARPGNTHGEIARVSYRMALIDLSNTGIRRSAPEYMRQEQFA